MNEETIVVIEVLVVWLYFAGFESSRARATPGKAALGIVVADTHGCQLSFGRATVRTFAKALSPIAFGAGFIMAAFTERKQALHDKLASTTVIRMDAAAAEPADVGVPGALGLR